MKKIQNILIVTNSQKVLNFFLDYPEKEFIEKDIQKATKISKSGVNYALRELAKTDVLFRKKKGKMCFYSLNYKNSVVKQLKVLKIIIHIQPIVKRLEKISSKVILFGSCCRGENIEDSDIDLFVVTNYKREEIEKEINKFRLKRKIQLIIRTLLGYVELRKKDVSFYEQVQQGIVLWEKE
jgi:predicted nucleotidyltransferase